MNRRLNSPVELSGLILLDRPPFENTLVCIITLVKMVKTVIFTHSIDEIGPGDWTTWGIHPEK